MTTIPEPSVDNAFLKEHVALLRNSFRRLLNKPLAPPDLDDAEAAAYLYAAPMVLLSHDTAADPIFNYANQAALTLFELTWKELVALPSRYSAEAVNRDERRRLLDQVSSNGYIDQYQGVRIAKSGKRFLVNNATVWNLYDSDETYRGQAACFSDWRYID